ncbi:unnamed protein product [Rhizophagus irregularis]|nr:unnamed protein product [Rhizophagus irregularis]
MMKNFIKWLEEIRFNTISDTTWAKLVERSANYDNEQSLDLLLTTTLLLHIVKSSKQINNTICNMLPVNADKYLIAESIDFVEGKTYTS